VRVRDDGAGIDLEAVRRRATELGLVRPGETAASERLLELLFTQGFSTRNKVTETSGRGVGLDAAREAMAASGGGVTIRTAPGAGTTLEILAPRAQASLDVYTFRTATGDARIAVEASWMPAECPADGTEVDLDVTLDLTEGTQPGAGRAVAFSRDGAAVRFLSSRADLRREAARRVCRTPDGAPFEIVALENGHAVLVRPAALPPR
jgi:hypothetical protein